MRTDHPSTCLPSLSFQQVTTIKFCNPFVLITIQNAAGAWGLRPCFASTAANLHLCFQSLPRCSSRNPFLFIHLHCCRGVAGSLHSALGVPVVCPLSQPQPSRTKAALAGAGSPAFSASFTSFASFFSSTYNLNLRNKRFSLMTETK